MDNNLVMLLVKTESPLPKLALFPTTKHPVIIQKNKVNSCLNVLSIPENVEVVSNNVEMFSIPTAPTPLMATLYLKLEFEILALHEFNK